MSNATKWTAEMVMFYACDKAGLAGETRRAYPESYYATHAVRNGGVTPMAPVVERLVRDLLANGYLEARTRTFDVKETRGTGFLDCPAHVLTSTTYHATDAGRAAWVARTL